MNKKVETTGYDPRLAFIYNNERFQTHDGTWYRREGTTIRRQVPKIRKARQARRKA